MACLPFCREIIEWPEKFARAFDVRILQASDENDSAFLGKLYDASVKEIAPLPLDVTGTVLLAYRELWLELEHCPDRKRLKTRTGLKREGRILGKASGRERSTKLESFPSFKGN
jgi:hypothetical protein